MVSYFRNVNNKEGKKEISFTGQMWSAQLKAMIPFLFHKNYEEEIRKG